MVHNMVVKVQGFTGCLGPHEKFENWMSGEELDSLSNISIYITNKCMCNKNTNNIDYYPKSVILFVLFEYSSKTIAS